MSDYESDSDRSFASEVDEIDYRGGAAKKKAAAAAAAEKRAAAAVAAATKKPTDAAAADSDADEDDESTVADDDDESAAAGADSDVDDDDESAAAAGQDDDDEPFNDDDGGSDDEVAGRNIPARFEINEQDDDDADEDDYMGKFDENTRKNVIEQFYPELIQQNYEEIETLTAIIRDKDGFIVDPLHQTLPILTKYEKTRILGERARQIGTGAPTLIEVDEDIIDPYLIALKELEAKKVPFIIKRPVPNGGIEYWRVSDLEVI